MALADRPTIYPDFATGSSAQLAQPTASTVSVGYVPGDRPAAQNLNWQLNALGNWVRYLDATTSATGLTVTTDQGMRLVGGGQFSFAATTGAVTWSQPAYVMVPGLATTANTLPAGTVTLADGQLAYATLFVPVSAKADLQAGSTALANVSSTAGMSQGMAITGQGIASGTTIAAVADNALTLSQAATGTVTQATIIATGSGTLSLQAANPSTMPLASQAAVFMLRSGPQVYVGLGSGQMTLRDGEQKYLLEAGYLGAVRLPAGTALAARQAVYTSPGTADGRVAGSAYLTDASGGNGAWRANFIGFATAAANSGDLAVITTAGLMGGFSGLTPGAAYYLDPTVVGGISAAKPTAAGSYICPVGMAVSATQLVIKPSGGTSAQAVSQDLSVGGNLTVAGTTTARSVVSAQGFRQTVDMGTLGIAAGTAAAQQTFAVVCQGSSGTFTMARYWVAEAAGSVLAVKIATDTYFQQAITLVVSKYIGGSYAPLWSSTNALYGVGSAGGNAIGGAMYNNATKGQYPFNAGDVLAVTFLTSAVPTAQNGASVAVRVECQLTVEMAA